MPSDQIYALQKSLHGYSAATLSALKGLGLPFHDLITAFTPWPDVEPAAQTSKGSSQQFLPLSLDYAWIKSGLIKFINTTTVVLKAKQSKAHIELCWKGVGRQDILHSHHEDV